MVEMIFKILHMIGYTHPVHPPLTHIPMGMVMGAFIFGLTGLVLKKPDFFKVSHYCVGLGLIFIPPTVIAGILDWLHTLDGKLEKWIMIKMVLAVILTLLMGVSFAIGHKDDANPKILLVFHILCLMCAVGLGFSGGMLVYG